MDNVARSLLGREIPCIEIWKLYVYPSEIQLGFHLVSIVLWIFGRGGLREILAASVGPQ